MSRFLRRTMMATALTAAVSASAVVPAHAWENTYQTYEEAGNNEGMCILEFTEAEQQRINGAYELLFETLADMSAAQLKDKKNADIWYPWAKENPNKDPLAWHLGTKYKGQDVGNAQRILATIHPNKSSGPYYMAGNFLKQSRKPILEERTLKITPYEAAERKGSGAVKVGDFVAPGLWGIITGSLKIGAAADMAKQALNKLGPRIQPVIKDYEAALTACEEGRSTSGKIREGSSLDTNQFIGLVAGGVLGGLALLGFIAVAVGPLVNDFFTNFWKNAGVLR